MPWTPTRIACRYGPTRSGLDLEHVCPGSTSWRSGRISGWWTACRGLGTMSCVSSRLLERDEELRVLDLALDRAGAGEGAVVLLSGEAGIGKTALVRAFCSKALGRAQLLVGGCDDLLTPRTLGPLRDAVRVGGGPLAEALGAGDPESIFSAVLAQLSARAPTVLVVEDMHWSDAVAAGALDGHRQPRPGAWSTIQASNSA
jgi:hypothetical protein